MEKIKWLQLQNGSDIRGIATDGIPGEEISLTSGIVEEIAVSFIAWVTQTNGCDAGELTIAVGRDSRISGPLLMDSFLRGIVSTGANAVDCGMASTPAMFMATLLPGSRSDASVMLTASHLPFNRNGLKFFTRKGGLDKADITCILESASAGKVHGSSKTGTVTHFDLLEGYSGFLINTVRKEVNDPVHYDTPLYGFHIVVDAGNGAGGFYADRVLKPLGADTSGSQFLDPDGMFPNHIPNPEDQTAMASVTRAVADNKADIGLIFDTDVDRSAAVDQSGTSINRNRLIALMSAIVLEEHPGSWVVTDSITSDGLSEFIQQELKGKHLRFKRGYKNVINEAIRLNKEGKESWLAIETSGHAALKENHFLDDGAFLVTKLLIKAAKMRRQGRSLTDLTEKLRVPAESEEFRLRIYQPDFKEYGNMVINDLKEFVKLVDGWQVVPENYEGIRISCNAESGDGWFLLRLSLHDPVIPLNIESNRKGGVTFIASNLSGFFSKYSGLSKLQVPGIRSE
jgi:phosphomannomutase